MKTTEPIGGCRRCNRAVKFGGFEIHVEMEIQ
jgi:hypothetical protein